MSARYSILFLSSVATLLLASGCGKSEPPAPPAPPTPKVQTETPKPAETPLPPTAAVEPTPAPAAPAASAPPPSAPVAKPAEQPAAAATTPTAPAGSSLDTTQLLGILGKAKDEAKAGNYKDALKSVKQLKDYSLTADQQKTVDQAKTEIQTMLAKKTAGSAVGDILGNKK